MKKVLILLLLVGNLCQPAYGFGLSSVNSLFSSIRESVSSCLETASEHKVLSCGIATLGSVSIYFLCKDKPKNPKRKPIKYQDLMLNQFRNFLPQYDGLLIGAKLIPKLPSSNDLGIKEIRNQLFENKVAPEESEAEKIARLKNELFEAKVAAAMQRNAVKTEEKAAADEEIELARGDNQFADEQ